MTKSDNDSDSASTGKNKRKKANAKPKARAYQRPRGGPARSISDLMPEIGRAAFRRFGFVQSSVVSRWSEIVGERYANVSMPESIKFPHGKRDGGTLHLVVSGAHATLIQHVTPEIVERVNQFFGYAAVDQIRIKQGVVKAPKTKDIGPSTSQAAPPNLKPIPIELGESLRDIGDPELHAVLESFARGLANSDGPPQIGSLSAGEKKKEDDPE